MKRHIPVWGQLHFEEPHGYNGKVDLLMDSLRDPEDLLPDEERQSFRDSLKMTLLLDYQGMVEAIDKAPNAAGLRKEFDDTFNEALHLTCCLDDLSCEAEEIFEDVGVNLHTLKKDLGRLYEASEHCRRKFEDRGVGRPEKQALKIIVHKILRLFYRVSRPNFTPVNEIIVLVRDALSLNPSFPLPGDSLIRDCIRRHATA